VHAPDARKNLAFWPKKFNFSRGPGRREAGS
jgi:hypothetical protein